MCLIKLCEQNKKLCGQDNKLCGQDIKLSYPNKILSYVNKILFCVDKSLSYSNNLKYKTSMSLPGSVHVNNIILIIILCDCLV